MLRLPATKPLRNEFRAQIWNFSTRVQELWNNWDDLFPDVQTLTVTYSDEKGIIKVDGISVNYYRLKSLYVDFRPFLLNDKEKFQSVCNQIGRHFRHKEVELYLEREKSAWAEQGQCYHWHQYDIDFLFNALFNARIFHSDAAKQEVLRNVLSRMTEDALKSEILFKIEFRKTILNNLRLHSKPVTEGSSFINLPEEEDFY